MEVEILQPGTVVAGRYRIERLIGTGGFARIYRAVEVGLRRTVALKVLSTRVDGKPDLDPVRNRFMREAQLISQLQDPRIVTIYGYDFTEDGLLYMALEHVDGLDLQAVVKRDGPLPADRIERLTTQVLLALREAHSLDCLHRDIKPSNIMVYDRLGETDCVKLLDFGIAKAVLAEHEMGEDLTREGAVIGTPGYMSPEQLMGRPLTPASDLFSLGVVLYEMYAGRSPYVSRDATEVYRRMQRFGDDLGDLGSAPSPLVDLGRALLEPDANRRIHSADEALDILGTGLPELDLVSEDLDATLPVSGRRTVKVGPRRPALAFPLGFDRLGHTPRTALTQVIGGGSDTETDDTETTTPVPVMRTTTPTAEAPGPAIPPTLAADAPEFGPSRQTKALPVAIFIAAIFVGAFVVWAAIEPSTGRETLSEAPREKVASAGEPSKMTTVSPADSLANVSSGGDDLGVGSRDAGKPAATSRENILRARAIVDVSMNIAAGASTRESGEDAAATVHEVRQARRKPSKTRPSKARTPKARTPKNKPAASETESTDKETFEIVPFE